MTYFVYTYDWGKEDFTPQEGIKPGPYTLRQMKRVIRKLWNLGYQGVRDGDVWIERRGEAYVQGDLFAGKPGSSRR